MRGEKPGTLRRVAAAPGARRRPWQTRGRPRQAWRGPCGSRWGTRRSGRGALVTLLLWGIVCIMYVGIVTWSFLDAGGACTLDLLLRASCAAGSGSLGGDVVAGGEDAAGGPGSAPRRAARDVNSSSTRPSCN